MLLGGFMRTLVAVVLSGIVGCTPADPTVARSPGDVDPQLLAPLEALGPCPPSPSPAADAPEGLYLPAGAAVTTVEVTGPLTNVQGWLPLTPVEVRVHYQRLDAVDVISVEDEIIESEVLVSDGTYRLFVKAQAACERGSVFVAVRAQEAEADAVPTPAGTGP